MRPLTEDEIRGAFVNATEDDLRVMAMPHSLLLTEWDFLDFFTWCDPHARGRGYLVVERDGKPTAVVLRAANSSASSARRAGAAGAAGDAIGTYICADLTCHENVRLAAPLTPLEVRADGMVDVRIDGARRRLESFVDKVLAVRVS